MTGIEALHSVQFVSNGGRRFAVLSADDWESLVEWLEALEDKQIVGEASAQLDKAKGNRMRAGWMKWNDIRDELA